jgi:hypothetical protein
MQTLIDPFELASPVSLPAARDVASTLVDIDVQLEEDARSEWDRRSEPPGPDSSARLRCWCTEED